MSLGIKTQSGIQRIHSVRVAKDIYIELPLESGGYTGAAIVDEILEPDNGAQVSDERCRGKSVVYLPAGTYIIGKSTTADNDIQLNIAQHYLGTDSTEYVFKTSVTGDWLPSVPATVTLATDGYISVLVRKEDNVSITPETAGGYIIIRKT